MVSHALGTILTWTRWSHHFLGDVSSQGARRFGRIRNGTGTFPAFSHLPSLPSLFASFHTLRHYKRTTMAQSPAHEGTDPIGKGSVSQTDGPKQLSDAQQRPGGQEGGVSGTAVQNAKNAAASLGEQAPGTDSAQGRKDIETK
ncbi:hypothetical protein BD324DRAFT_68025 [Kockovaella imperatae]|uniref:Uncharacterized protein n=1 Tax=Kockovaella imperatae TaxID=4999 RepID=A0A1Y1UDR9_9TREE|nr:hypothetical protein BD324DRAFT_68025 [Kockovaella imperatae]ORX35664.1 hypothetical protein BD324DRAFT_68025 [Kockovaella imperatae]